MTWLLNLDPLCRWLIGLMISVILGGILTWIFLTLLRVHTNLGKDPQDIADTSRPVPPWLTGVVERAFFTTILGLNVSGVPTAMIAWIGLKMVTNWNREGAHPAPSDFVKQTRWIRGAFTALLAGLVSMLFAALGGVICRGSVD